MIYNYYIIYIMKGVVCMRLLVLSDSHGRKNLLLQAVELHPEADAVIFLGDGERDIDFLKELHPEIKLYAVCGNCDFNSSLPPFLIEKFGGRTVYAAHGHYESVKYSLAVLMQKAHNCSASIALYGHTHVPDTKYDDEILYVNPGSVSVGKYAMVDITDKGIMPILCDLYK